MYIYIIYIHMYIYVNIHIYIIYIYHKTVSFTNKVLDIIYNRAI